MALTPANQTIFCPYAVQVVALLWEWGEKDFE
jgi:hypothetical protein